MMTGEHASVVEQELDAVLAESVLLLNAIGDLFTNRQNAIVSLQTARGTLQGKQKQYESVKGAPWHCWLWLCYRPCHKNTLFSSARNDTMILVPVECNLSSSYVCAAAAVGDPRKTGRAHELAREIAEAEEEEKMAREHYDMIKASMADELERFQKERSSTFRDMLMGYARCNAEYHQAISGRWQELLKDLESEFSSM